MSRKLTLWLALLAVVVVGVLWLSLNTAPPVDEHAQAPSSAATAASDGPAAAALALEARPAIEREAVAEPSPPMAIESAATDTPATTLTTKAARKLTGTIVALDAHGDAHATENGSLEFIQLRRQRTTSQTVAVRLGRWSADVAGDEQILFLGCVLAGRVAVFDTQKPVDLPENGAFDLAVRWLESTLLHVVADESGEELREVELLAEGEWASLDSSLPPSRADKTVLFTNASSPLEIVPTASLVQRGTLRLYAHAPGYAWGRIDLDMTAHGERRLSLKTVGALDVTLFNHEHSTGDVLRLRGLGPDSAEPLLERSISRRDGVTLEDIEARPYRLSIEIGDWFRSPVVLASAEVVVFPGQTTKIALTLDKVPPSTLVQLGGTLVIPREWQVDTFSLVIQAIKTTRPNKRPYINLNKQSMRPVENRDDAYRWLVPSVEAGTYRVQLDQPLFAQAIEVGTEGKTDVELVVPPPGHVRMRVIDKTTSETADVPFVLVGVGGSGEGFAASVASFARDKSSGLFEFNAPVGAIYVNVHAPFQSDRNRRFEVHAGQNELTLDVERSSGFILIFKDGTATVPSEIMDVTGRRTDGEGMVSGHSYGGGEPARHTVSSPGTYRITIPKIDGFAPVPEQEVVVKYGEYAQLTIALERAR